MNPPVTPYFSFRTQGNCLFFVSASIFSTKVRLALPAGKDPALRPQRSEAAKLHAHSPLHATGSAVKLTTCRQYRSLGPFLLNWGFNAPRVQHAQNSGISGFSIASRSCGAGQAPNVLIPISISISIFTSVSIVYLHICPWLCLFLGCLNLRRWFRVPG